MITVDDFITKYLGRKFGTGASICFRFVQAVYRDEFGIEIKNDYLETLSAFKETKEPVFGDVVIMHFNPLVTDHIGVYLKNGFFAQCGAGKGMDEVIISHVTDSRWKRRIRGYLRHPSMR